MHQPSLEGLIDFSVGSVFGTVDERTRAKDKFYRTVNHFEAADGDGEYNRPALIRLTFEYAGSEESQDMLLHAFFQSTNLYMTDEDCLDLDGDRMAKQIRPKVFGFADYLLDHFFLPCVFPELPLPLPANAFPISTSRYGRNAATIADIPCSHPESTGTGRTQRISSGRRNACRSSGAVALYVTAIAVPLLAGLTCRRRRSGLNNTVLMPRTMTAVSSSTNPRQVSSR